MVWIDAHSDGMAETVGAKDSHLMDPADRAFQALVVVALTHVDQQRQGSPWMFAIECLEVFGERRETAGRMAFFDGGRSRCRQSPRQVAQAPAD